MELTHLDKKSGQPRMVNVSEKTLSTREAVAQGEIRLPPEVLACLQGDEIMAPKGPVFQTAIIAGTQAAKQTSALIPFCHPLALEKIDISIKLEKELALIEVTVGLTGKTGVEMEALTACSIAALTIYDMCKALGSDMTIGNIRLMAKRGGKRDFDLRS